MQRFLCFLLSFVMALALSSCGEKTSLAEPSETAENAPSWQEQYDLGVRYLSEGNYEEAIIAFSAAIEIDPKPYAAYIGLADSYIGLGDYDQAKDILLSALETVNDSDSIYQYLHENFGIQRELDGYPKTVRGGTSDGGYQITEYDQYGNVVRREWYDENDNLTTVDCYSYDEMGKLAIHTKDSSKVTSSEGYAKTYTEEFYDDQQRLSSISEVWIFADGTTGLQWEHAYSYPDEKTAMIHVERTEDGITLVTSKSYTLNGPGNYAVASGFSASPLEGELKITHIWEYAGPPPSRSMVRDVRYDNNGNELTE